MRTLLERSIVAVAILSILCGCSSGGGKSWSMASLNPFKPSSNEVADSAAPPFEKPSATADPTDSLPSASDYASRTERTAPGTEIYPEKTASYSGGYNSPARSGYQSGQSSYSSVSPGSSAGYSSLDSSSLAVTPQHGYYGSGADYSTASRSNSPSSAYSFDRTSSSPSSRESSAYPPESSAYPPESSAYPPESSAYPPESTRDFSYASPGRDTASANGYSPYTGSSYTSPADTGSSYTSPADTGSRYATGAERWGTSGSAASGYDQPKSDSTGFSSTYPSSNGSASQWTATDPAATGSGFNDSSRYGSADESYAAAPVANKYAADRRYLPDSGPGTSFSDRYADASTESGLPPTGSAWDSAASSPWSRPAPTASNEPAAYVPGQTGYTPSNSGFQPTGTAPYQPPTAPYGPPGTTRASDSGFSPGSTDRYRSNNTSGSSPTGSYPSATGCQSGGCPLPANG